MAVGRVLKPRQLGLALTVLVASLVRWRLDQ